MEGLEYGWQRPITTCHYFPGFRSMSLCCAATFRTSPYRTREFLADAELAPEMRVCQDCKEILANEAKFEIIVPDPGRKDCRWEQVTCAKLGCNKKGIAPASNFSDKRHYCILHNRRVINAAGCKKAGAA